MNKLTFHINVFLITAFSSLPVFAEDLLTVYQYALKNDPQFRAARAEYKAIYENISQSRSFLLPSLSISAHSTQNDDKITTTTLSESDYDSNGYSLNLTQPIYRHENYVGLRQANAQVAQARASFESAKQDLVLRVTTQYFTVLAAGDDLEYALAERKAIKEQLVQTKQRFNVGLTAITDVHEAQARYDQAVARAIVAENALSISHETLREITSKEHKKLSPLSREHPLVTPKPNNVKRWVEQAQTQNFNLIASLKGVDVALEEVSRQSAGHYPRLDLVASHTNNDYEGGLLAGERENNTISLQFSMQLYQGGLISSRTRAANYRLTQARENLEQQSRATERLTRTTFLSVIANISQVKALKQALASSQVALEATQAGFEVGTRTAVDVLDSQRGLYLALRDYAQVRYNYVLETLRLKLAAGTLSETDIKQLNPWLK